MRPTRSPSSGSPSLLLDDPVVNRPHTRQSSGESIPYLALRRRMPAPPQSATHPRHSEVAQQVGVEGRGEAPLGAFVGPEAAAGDHRGGAEEDEAAGDHYVHGAVERAAAPQHGRRQNGNNLIVEMKLLCDSKIGEDSALRRGDFPHNCTVSLRMGSQSRCDHEEFAINMQEEFAIKMQNSKRSLECVCTTAACCSIGKRTKCTCKSCLA